MNEINRQFCIIYKFYYKFSIRCKKMVKKYPKSLDKMVPKIPMHGRKLGREEVWTEGHMKANALMALLCGLEFMKEKNLNLKEYYDYLGQKTAQTWDKSVFLTQAKKKTGAHGFLKTMILMYEGMLCNIDEGLEHELKQLEKKSTLTMECFGAAVLKRFAEINPKISVDELCPLCAQAIIGPIIERLGMKLTTEQKPGEKCQWTVEEI